MFLLEKSLREKIINLNETYVDKRVSAISRSSEDVECSYKNGCEKSTMELTN